MTQPADHNKGIAGSAVLMFITAMGAAWMIYSWLLPQDVLTFLILLAYIPIVGGIAVFLYRRLRIKPINENKTV